jgi:hypothetical protein
MKAGIVLFALAVSLYAQTDMKDALLNYGFERVRLTNAGRSRIIDFIKQNQMDSLRIIINFCDSINSPNRDWLSNSERFFIEVVKENWSLLKKDSLYKADFNLSDTARDDSYYPGFNYGEFGVNRFARRYTDDGCLSNPSPIPANEDLYKFLNLTYTTRLSRLKATMPAESYLWDFFDILVSRGSMGPRGYKSQAPGEYLVKYPASPFYKLVMYNYYFRYKPSGSGAMLGMGGGYLSFDDKTSALFKDRANFYAYLDICIRHIPLKVGFTVMSQDLNGYLIKGRDTLPPGASLTNMTLSIGTGYLFHANNQLHCTPYGALSIFMSSLNDSSKKYLHADPSYPPLFGLRLGTTLDFQFVPQYGVDNNFGGEASAFGVRLDAGVAFHDFSRLGAGLGNVALFANIGFGIIAFGQDRIYAVGK